MQIQSSADRQVWLDFVRTTQQARIRNTVLSRTTQSEEKSVDRSTHASSKTVDAAALVQKRYGKHEPQEKVVFLGTHFDAYA